MIIGYDAKRIFHNATGLGNYGRDTIRILSQYYPENEYLLFNPKPPKTDRLGKTGPQVKEILPKTFFSKRFPSFWRLKPIVKQLKESNIQLYHGLTNELPLGIANTKIKTVVTIHDLIFLRYPALYPLIDRNIYHRKFKYACRTADRIIAISQQTKEDIINFFSIDPQKIEVIYQGCHEAFKRRFRLAELQKVKEKYQLPDKFILNVGTIEQRKNLLSLVKAITKLDTVDLVIIGKEKPYAEKVKSHITANQLENRIHFLRNIDIYELAAIYQLASVFVYPSIFEGFGIPISESLFSQTPVITSKDSCFAEAGGPDSLYVDPMDIDELRNAIERLWHNDELRIKISDSGFRYASQFTDEKIGHSLINLYNDLIFTPK